MKPRFFKLARKLSFNSDYNPQKLGCVIVRGNAIIGVGFNKNKTHTKSNNRFKTIHAELSAVLNAGNEDLNGCDAYIYRETKAGELAISRPCAFCMKLLKDIGIKRIYWTDRGTYKVESLD